MRQYRKTTISAFGQFLTATKGYINKMCTCYINKCYFSFIYRDLVNQEFSINFAN